MEISIAVHAGQTVAVALLAEGVDRNIGAWLATAGRLLSPSSRRAWIEIREYPNTPVSVQGRPPRGGRG